MLDATPFLRPERALFLELLRSLNDDDWARPTECPAWTVKGVALHVLGDDFSLLSRQRDASIDGLSLFAPQHPDLQFRALLDGFNEQWVTAATFLSNELIIELLRLVGEWSAEFYTTVGLDTIAREPVGFFAQTEPSPYWQLIAREYAERFIHQSQIRRAINAPELDGELRTGAAQVTAHVLAAWLRDYTPRDGATMAIDFGNGDVWTWRRESDHWSVAAGNASDADARITIASDRTVALLSRGLALADVSHAMTIEGDTALARAALQLVSPLLAP